MSYKPVKPKEVVMWVVGVIAGIALVIAVIIGIYVGFKAVGRAQARADAANRVRISEIEIRNQAQRVEIAKQKAEVRKQDAIGVREAQDEIAKTLTPLYVQFEMVEALKAIAMSGNNNTVVYIPSGANGIPLVSTVKDGQVGSADGG
ncbi:MAG TPA: hypothetical protein VF244_10985 [Acidimicrobiales bacterium]